MAPHAADAPDNIPTLPQTLLAHARTHPNALAQRAKRRGVWRSAGCSPS